MLKNKLFNCWKHVTIWRNNKNKNNDKDNDNDSKNDSKNNKNNENNENETVPKLNILDTYINTSIANTKKNENETLEDESKVNELTDEIKTLKEKLFAIENKSWGNYVDQYIDKWYDVNKKEVDIGVVNVGGLFNIDLLPDRVEKYLYKKVIKIIFSMVSDLKS
jgi:hypothetical protein